jgi:hypothetical protein
MKTNSCKILPQTSGSRPLFTPDRRQAEAFIKSLCGHNDAHVHFRTIHDQDKTQTARNYYGSLAANWSKLVADNREGRGIFIQVNPNDGRGKSAANIVGVRGQWVDCDHGLPESLLLTPSIVVQSSAGKEHYYWLFSEVAAVDAEFTKVQKQLIAYYDSDPSIHNLDRIMRLPGFYHCKREPQMTKLISVSNKRYTREEIAEGLPELVGKLKSGKRNTTQTIGSIHDSLAPVIALVESMRAKPEAYSLRISETEVDNRFTVAQGIVERMEMGKNVNDSLLSLGVCLSGIAYNKSVRDLLAAVHRAMRQKFGAKGYNRYETTRTFLKGVSYGLYGLDKADEHTLSRQLTLNTVDVGEGWFPSIVGESATVLALKGSMGSGKTTAIRELISKHERVLVISHRKRLVAMYAHDCDGFVAYDDECLQKNRISLTSVPRLVITLDSLHKLQRAGCELPTYDLYVFDECDQGLEHLLLSSTLKSERRQAVETLYALVRKNPKAKIVLSSATLSDTDVNAIMKLSKRELADLKSLVSSKKAQARNYVVCESEAVLVAKLLEHMEQGHNCFVASDSKARVERLERQLQKVNKELKTWCITSANSDDDEVADINKSVQKYQVVLSSPSLATGVDINNKHFDVVFGLFTNYRDIPYTDCLQAVNRVRYPKLNTCYVYISSETGGKQLTEQEVADIEKITEVKLDFQTLDLETLELQPINEEVYAWVRENQVKLLHRRHEDKRYRAQKFWKAIRAQGHKVTKASEVHADLQQVKQELDAAGQELKKEHVELVANAELLTREEVDKLKDKPKLSKQEQAAVDKHYISSSIGREATEEDVHAWNNGTLKQTVKLYRLLAGGLAEAERKTAATLDRYARDRDYSAYEWHLLTGLVELVNSAMKTTDDGNRLLTKSALTEAGFTDFISEHSKDIRVYLGLTVHASRPTVTANQLLRLLGFTVKAKDNRRKTKATTSKSLNLSNKEQGVTGGNEGRAYLVYKTEEQQELTARLTQRYTPEDTSDEDGII